MSLSKKVGLAALVACFLINVTVVVSMVGEPPIPHAYTWADILVIPYAILFPAWFGVMAFEPKEEKTPTPINVVSQILLTLWTLCFLLTIALSIGQSVTGDPFTWREVLWLPAATVIFPASLGALSVTDLFAKPAPKPAI